MRITIHAIPCWSLVFTALLTISGCRSHETSVDFEITSFQALTNTEFTSQFDSSIVSLQADLEHALLTGIRIPTEKQCEDGKLGFTFTIKRTNAGNEKLYYKLYFQNASYKFDESNPLSSENFYGSWSDSSADFKPLPDFTDEIEVTDSLVIEGNPRNELLYFGESPLLELVDADSVRDQMKLIESDQEWFSAIVQKAAQEKRTIEKQLLLDAEWIVKQSIANMLLVNNRQWRNPRMGQYEFMLVVISESNLNKLPSHQLNLSNRDQNGRFVNPFAYFAFGEGSNSPHIQHAVSDRRLKVYAKYETGNGIYVPEPNDSLPNRNHYSSTCGDSELLYKNAQFQQFFSAGDQETPLYNVPFVESVLSPSFTVERYNALKRQYRNSANLSLRFIKGSDCPCKTVHSKREAREIILVNPGNQDVANPKKENVGVQGRIGMTYGKWVAKIQFPRMVNSHQVWTGIANVFGLISQSPNSAWNQRRTCNHPIAYIPHSAKDVEGSSLFSRSTDGYSRIDLELVSASERWPAVSSGESKGNEVQEKLSNGNIMAVCSNWDLACHEPSSFFTGVKSTVFENEPFVHYRANDWQKMLISKAPVVYSRIAASNYFFFEIEWQPTKIIWRVGPERDKMEVLCVMDDSITTIPNNQMLPVVTQEWLTKAPWYLSSYEQNFIPYPKDDVVGRIMELWVE